MLSPPSIRAWAAFPAALLVACSGEIAAPTGSSGGGALCEAPSVPAAVVRRLTRDQFDLTIRDLLGDTTAPARAFPPDDDFEGFHVGGDVSSLYVEQEASAAEALAEVAAAHVVADSSCDLASGDCADAWITAFARQGFRRAVTPEDLDRLRTVFDVGLAEGEGPQLAVQLVIQTVLMSGSFLYHDEVAAEDAEDGDIVLVQDYALASRLSYFLWGSMPDEALLDAAAAGVLQTEEGLLAEARRMLEDDKAREGFRSFTRQWLLVDRIDRIVKDETVHPEFTAQVAADLEASLQAFLDEVWETGDGRLLYTADFGYVNARTADLFGVDGSELGEELERVPLNTEQRSGLLTHPGLLALNAKANQSDPIHRALFVRERMLCQHLPSPPADITVVAPDPAPGLTTRQRFAEHSNNPACTDCHRLLDPLGFGFEHYDAVGAWRDTEQGTAVDASGFMNGTDDMNGEFYGAVDLAGKLIESNQVRSCMARQLFRFALQRVETQADSCSMEGIDRVHADGSLDLRELMLAVVASDAFRYQQVSR
tara:strand:+ start:1315 stop:2931 length:1617 start_codon:yes stop_codon:yes gene_type:complete